MLVIVDIKPDAKGVPVKAYRTVDQRAEKEERVAGGAQSEGAEGGGKRTFVHIGAETGATEAEEVGVEHLLRDINDPSKSTLAGKIGHKAHAIRELQARLEKMRDYLQAVLDGKLEVNNSIVYNMQKIFFLLPNAKVESLVKAMMVKTNDTHLAIYLGSLVRSIIALHDLVDNKIKYKDHDDDDDDAAAAKKKKAAEAKKKKEAEEAKKKEEADKKKKKGK